MSDYSYDPRNNPFKPSAQQFEANNALLLSCAANLVYEDTEIIEPIVKSWGFKDYSFFDNKRKGTQAFVSANSRTVLIAFRGTEPTELKDVKADLKVIKERSVAGRVHRGFKGALDGVWLDLLDHVKRVRRNNQRIWVTGHSLGAALATLATARLQMANNIPVQGLITFGQPRTGNKEFAKAFDRALAGRVYRFVNNTDLVTRVPPAKAYYHIGRRIYFTRDGRATNELTRVQRFLDRLSARRRDLGKLGTKGMKDHSMDIYVKRVRKNLKTILNW